MQHGLEVRFNHVPTVSPERLLHTAKVFTTFLHCNNIPKYSPYVLFRHRRRRIKTAEEPQIEKDTVLGDLQCKLQHMNGRGSLRGYALEAP
jgi:hypothetical protein